MLPFYSFKNNYLWIGQDACNRIIVIVRHVDLPNYENRFTFIFPIHFGIVGCLLRVHAPFAIARYWISRLLRILWFRPLDFIHPGDHCKEDSLSDIWKKNMTQYGKERKKKEKFYFFVTVRSFIVFLGKAMRLLGFSSPSVTRWWRKSANTRWRSPSISFSSKDDQGNVSKTWRSFVVELFSDASLLTFKWRKSMFTFFLQLGK